MINTTSESLKPRKVFIFQHLVFYEGQDSALFQRNMIFFNMYLIG